MNDPLTDHALGITRGVHDSWCPNPDPHRSHPRDEEGVFCPGVGPQPLPGGIGTFKLACRLDEVPEVLAFDSPATRGKWASQHTRETGHDSWLVRDRGEIAITFVAECPDCRDFAKLMDAAEVIDERKPPLGDTACGFLREAAMAIVTNNGMPPEYAELIRLYQRQPKEFGTAGERDRYAEGHSSSAGHHVGKRTEFR